MTVLVLDEVERLHPLLQPIERRAIAFGIEIERVRGYRDNHWLSVRIDDSPSNTLGFHVVDGQLAASMTAHATNDPVALVENARKVAETYRLLMAIPETPPVDLRIVQPVLQVAS
ncbi:MAG: hypothetical protein JNM17_06710 [Archangium sp.]|nr:hypothetical protein [Archangium sp.]